MKRKQLPPWHLTVTATYDVELSFHARDNDPLDESKAVYYYSTCKWALLELLGSLVFL